MDSMVHWLIHGSVTAIFILLMVKAVYQPRKLEPSTASELTTFGILGTFTGIFFGLAPFVVGGDSNISKHIPNLIFGIGVATICSITGMALGLLSKHEIRKAKLAERAAAEEMHSGATADTLADLLRELVTQTDNQNKALFALQKSIAGNEDTTLLTQVQKLRTSFSDKQDELKQSFDEFARNMAKSNSEALIEALKEVIKDFNAKINEQFGDNFKQLNEAVGKLLEWQQEYRAEIELLQKQFQAAAEGIKSSEAALASIAYNSDALVQSAAKLEKLLTAYDSYQARLAEQLQAFASLSREAETAFPIIQNNIKALTEDFSGAVIASSAQIEKTVTQTSKRLEEQVTALDEALQEELTKSLSSLGNQLASLSGKFVTDYEPLTRRLQEIVKSASNGNNN